jgi:plasmid stabilization system protein ParE
MKIVFTKKAKRDLDDLREFLKPLNASALTKVVSKINLNILSILDNPNIGRQTSNKYIRELIEPKYGFITAYYIKNNTIFVLRIYQTKRKPLEYDSIKLPKT